ncbi:MAG: TfoX/Sxy family protein [Elusimicrobia bacterium]|nr:TfoX/Sxy family protein [Elusimicrobiota bacterium]
MSEIEMFGGLCFTLRGRMVVGVLKDELMVRLSKLENAATSREPYVRPMDLTGRRMKGFHFVNRAGLRTSPQLRRWIERCANYVATLPPKV